ncbi:MAG: helix-turn-helix transcriptional regulator [Burkholderiaceae bacterium]|nr:helix-turn-helix transcriptional regulator [Burkholderiaceae bacterium]
MEILPEGDARRNAGAGAHLTGLPGPTDPRNLPIPGRGDASIGASPILRGLLDTIDQGVLLIDSTCRLLYSNACAQESLDAQAVLCRDGERVLPAKVADRLVWRHAIDDAMRGQTRLFETNVQGTRHLASIAPFQWIANELDQKHLVILLGSGPAPAPHAGRLDVFADHCRLTRAETRVFLTLLDDLSPMDIAQRLEVAPATVRTHIRRILQKTGSPSMRSLLALITRLPASRPGG